MGYGVCEVLFLNGLGSLSSGLILHGDECVGDGYASSFETKEDRLVVEEGASFLDDDNFLLAPNFALSFLGFFVFSNPGSYFLSHFLPKL